MTQPLVTTYINPDLDGVAGAVAYAEYLTKTGTTCELGIIGNLDEETEFILSTFNIPTPRSIDRINDRNQVILLDVSEIAALRGSVAPEKVIEIIDHRKVNDAAEFPNAKIQIELVGSVATLISEKFMQHNIDVSRESALLMYGAIVSNTLHFKSAVTTDRDREAAHFLNTKLNLSVDFYKDLFKSKSDFSGSKLTDKIKGDSAPFIFGNKKVRIVQIEMIGARKLIAERGDEITQAIAELKEEHGLDLIFLNIIDLEECKTFFIAVDDYSKSALEKILSISFNNSVIEFSNMLLRKEIMPALKEFLLI